MKTKAKFSGWVTGIRTDRPRPGLSAFEMRLDRWRLVLVSRLAFTKRTRVELSRPAFV